MQGAKKVEEGMKAKSAEYDAMGRKLNMETEQQSRVVGRMRLGQSFEVFYFNSVIKQ